MLEAKRSQVLANSRATRTGTNEPRVQRLWLVRHGITDWNSENRFCGYSDVPLSVYGRTQAQWVAQQLKGRPVTNIYSSDLVRAQHTAQFIAQQQFVEPLLIHTSALWREMSFGDWEGLTYTQIAHLYKGQLAFFTDPMHHSPPNGEAFSQLVQRVQTAFRILVKASVNEEGDIVLVSHGGTLRVLLCHVLGMSFERQWQLRIDPGSLTALDFWPHAADPLSTVTLSALNLHPGLHFEGLV